MEQPTFAYEWRVLLCPNCGAPVRALPEGGRFPCAYCAAFLELARREEAPSIVRGALTSPEGSPADAEAARLKRLRESLASLPLSPYSTKIPSGLGHLYKARVVALERLPEALALWQKERAALASLPRSDTPRRFFFLTTAVAQMLLLRREPLPARAVYETALEVLSDPGYRHLVRCGLATAALRAGEVGAAEEWLRLCDGRSDDVTIDSAYRMVRAAIARAKGDHAGALSWLGREIDAVPIATSYAVAAGVRRADALEQLGELEAAVTELGHWMRGFRGLLARAALPLFIASADPPACSKSYPLARSRARRRRVVFWTAATLLAGGAVGGVAFFEGVFEGEPAPSPRPAAIRPAPTKPPAQH
jgi:hypothetical protein